MTTPQERAKRLQNSGNIPADQPRRRTLASPSAVGQRAIVTSVTVPEGGEDGIMMVRPISYVDSASYEQGNVVAAEEIRVRPAEGLTYDQYLWMVFAYIDAETTPIGVKAYPVTIQGNIAIPIFKIDSSVEFVDDSLSGSEGSSS